MSRLRAGVAALLGLCAAACATAGAPPLQADALTVSGREPAPRAEGGPLAGALSLAGASASAAVADGFGADAPALNLALEQAARRSLDNFGYLGRGGRPVTLDLSALTLREAEDHVGADAQVRLDGDAACLPVEGRGAFRSLRPTRSGAGQRAAAVLGLAALTAAAGGAPGAAAQASNQLFINQQFGNAAAQNRALNARRVVGPGEGVAPGHGDRAARRHAATHAVRLALADLLGRLGSEPCRSLTPPAG